jgi:hypothetical protein
MLACKFNLLSFFLLQLLISRFADRDMFAQYTHFGIGHPTLLWEMTRDCANANSELADIPDSEDCEDMGCESDFQQSEVEEAESDEDEGDCEELEDNDDPDQLEIEDDEEEEERLSF